MLILQAGHMIDVWYVRSKRLKGNKHNTLNFRVIKQAIVYIIHVLETCAYTANWENNTNTPVCVELAYR